MPEPDPVDEDAHLVRRIRGGDTAAYGSLVDRYQNRLRIALSYHCRSAESVEEFVQEAFVQAYINLDHFMPDHPFYPWLRSIAVNALRKDLRRRDSTRRNAPEYLRWLQLARLDGDEHLDLAERNGQVLGECIERLPERPRRLLIAHYREGQPLDEIATALSTTLGALRVRLVRIRSMLRECMERRLRTTAG